MRVLERFLNALHFVEACFIADETWEQMPAPSVVGNTRVGCVDFNRARMPLAIQAVLALSTSPKGHGRRTRRGMLTAPARQPTISGNCAANRCSKNAHTRTATKPCRMVYALWPPWYSYGTRSSDLCWQPKAVPGEAVHPNIEPLSTSGTPHCNVKCAACSRTSALQHEDQQNVLSCSPLVGQMRLVPRPR
jgi:hypothetical protein